MKKVGFILAAIAAATFIVGCASEPAPPLKQKTYKHSSKVYKSKLGYMSSQNDTKK